MESEDQDSEFTVDSVYRQEFELLKGMFEDHFSSEVIAGVLEDCYGDVNLAVDTLTKIEDATSSTVAENTSPVDAFNVENNSTEVSEYNSDNMAPSLIAQSFASVTQATTSAATRNTRTTRHPPRCKNTMPKVDYWTDQLRDIFLSYTDGNRVLVIMRGAPGCGKSYLAKVIVESTLGTSDPKLFQNHIFSADDFMVVDGQYHYDINRLTEVHKKSQGLVYKALCSGRSPVVVDNTNMTAWEMYPYVRDGVKNGYIIEVVEPCNPWSRIPSQLAKRTVHGVPQEKIQKMLNKYEGNFSGESLIKSFKLEYPEEMKPPIKRNKPPYQPLLPQMLHKENKKTIPKTKSAEANLQSVSSSPSTLAAENIGNDKSPNNKSTNKVAKSEYSNLSNQLQQKLSIVDENLDEQLNVETEWDNGDGWEMPSSQISVSPNSKKSNVVQKLSADPKPQRSKIKAVSNQFIEPSMLRDDWIDNLPSKCNIASSKQGAQNQGQIEIISNNNANEDKGNTIDALSGYIVKMPNLNVDLKESSSNKDINTSTVEGKCVHKQPHFKQLRKKFKFVPRAVLREIFDKCRWNYDWTCTIVAEGIKDNNLEVVGDEQPVSEDDEEVDCPCEYDKLRDIEMPDTFIQSVPASYNILQNETPLIKKKIKKDKILTDDTIQIKKQIENTVKISEHHYSQNYLNMRRRFVVTNPNYMASTSNNPGTSAPSTSGLDAVPSTSGTAKEEYNINDEEYDDEIIYDDMSGSDDEMVENVTVNIGMDFVRQLDGLYNRQDFEYPAGIKPELSIPTRILDELNALWIEAISNQMDKVNSQSEQMIKQDEEFARKLELQLEAEESESTDEENEGAVALDPKILTLKELMAEECALSYYEKQVKEEWKSKEPQDLAAQMTRKKLYELFPDVGQDTLSEILIAHENSFDNTVEVLMISTGQDAFLDQPNGINKFVIHKEKENNTKILKAEQEAALSEQEYPYLIKPGEEQTELTLDSVNEWRTRAQNYLTTRDDHYKRADWYLSRKNYSYAAHYHRLGAIQTSNYDLAQNFAAAALMQVLAFRKVNPPLYSNEETDDTLQKLYSNGNLIDLHFLRVAEAENTLDLFIDERIQKLRSGRRPTLVLHIITGRGNHSPGLARVKPAVIKRLLFRGLKIRHQNPGLLGTRLRPTHLLLDEILKN